MHPELMFVQDVKVLYNNILSEESSSVNLKIQILKNLQTYLQEEDSRMQEADRECKFGVLKYFRLRDVDTVLTRRVAFVYREEASQAGGSEGNGGHLIRHEQLHHADLPEAGAGVFLPLTVHGAALRPERHYSDAQSGPHPSCSGLCSSYFKQEEQF